MTDYRGWEVYNAKTRLSLSKALMATITYANVGHLVYPPSRYTLRRDMSAPEPSILG
jgi:hypothetical protein